MDKLYLKLLMALFFIIIGLAARRWGMLDEKIARRMTWVATNVLFPCLLFYTVCTAFEIALIREAGLIFLLAIAVSLIGYFFGQLFAGFFKLQDRMKRVFLLLSFKPATGLIGLPLCIILFGERSLFFAGPYAFGIGLIFYTLGLGLLKQGNFSWRSLVNPITVSIVFSILLALLKIDVSGFILRPMGFLGGFAVPIALIIVGSIFGMLNFKRGIIDGKMFLVAFNKLMLAPLLMFGVCIFLPIEPLAKRVAVIMAATPSSITASMWALRFNADYIWASSAALLVGILSIFTIGLFFWIVGAG